MAVARQAGAGLACCETDRRKASDSLGPNSLHQAVAQAVEAVCGQGGKAAVTPGEW